MCGARILIDGLILRQAAAGNTERISALRLWRGAGALTQEAWRLLPSGGGARLEEEKEERCEGEQEERC